MIFQASKEDEMSRKELVWLLLVLSVLNVIDTAATLLLAHRIGWEYEGNPILRWLFANVGGIPAVTLKMVGPIVLMVGLWLFCREGVRVWHRAVRWLPWLMIAIYAFVAFFNLTGVVVLWQITP